MECCHTHDFLIRTLSQVLMNKLTLQQGQALPAKSWQVYAEDGLLAELKHVTVLPCPVANSAC
jgi:hypothetical protein